MSTAMRAPGGRQGRVSGSAAGRSSAEHEILFQDYFKSVGPRTYAAQVKRAANDNHYLVLTEGKRDEKTGEIRKTRLFVYSEDFVALFKMVKSAAEFIKAHPVPDSVRQKRERFWKKAAGPGAGPRGPDRGAPPRAGAARPSVAAAPV